MHRYLLLSLCSLHHWSSSSSSSSSSCLFRLPPARARSSRLTGRVQLELFRSNACRATVIDIGGRERRSRRPDRCMLDVPMKSGVPPVNNALLWNPISGDRSTIYASTAPRTQYPVLHRDPLQYLFTYVSTYKKNMRRKKSPMANVTLGDNSSRYNALHWTHIRPNNDTRS